MSERFWEEKSLTQMTHQEWESLCDGCGKCCLHKLEEDSGKILYTNVACQLLNLKSCRCSRYANRTEWVPDCVQVKPDNIHQLKWMPKTCAYRLLAEGKPLPDWHPLITGTSDSVHQAGTSVLGWAVSEEIVKDLEKHIIDWTP